MNGQRVHFIGIGGIGMSGIARLYLARGARVSGSDAQDGPLLQRMRGAGAEIRIGHAAANVRGAGLVVYSSSITTDNPELAAARGRGIPVLHRGQAIARLASERKSVAVAGAHGKSTTTALSALLLMEAGLDPLVVIGAEVEAIGGNARDGEGRWSVVEADESDGSLLWLDPFAAIVTNIDEEHLDYFRNIGEIRETYAAFARRVQPGGVLIGCADDPSVARLLSACGSRTVGYGLRPGAQVTAERIELGGGGSRFRCRRDGKLLGPVRLQVPGAHNVLNSLAVVALSQHLGIEFRVAARSLESYRGAQRRFQIQGEVDGVMVVEDYAHHPKEIEATLQAAASWPGRRIRCVFQPHRYTRTRYLLDRFGGCFSAAHDLVILPIYAASETPIRGVSSEALAERVRASGHRRVELLDAEQAVSKLAADARPGDIVLFLGAGSVGALSRKLVERLRAGRSLEAHAHSA